jgi:hypothetical protein
MRERRDACHLRFAQREIEDRGILRQPFGFAGARNDHDVLLHQETQTHLRGGLFVYGADARERFVVARAALGDGAIGDNRRCLSPCSETTKLDRFWLEFSAVIPWLGGAESNEGIEVFGGAEGVHSQARG